MANDKEPPAAGFARTLLAKAAPGRWRRTEAAGLQPAGELAEAVGPSVQELVLRSVPEGFSRDEVEAVARKLLVTHELSPRENFVTEAIIIPELRPAVIVAGDDYAIDHSAWTDYAAGTSAHSNFRRAIPSVGRIELIGNPSLPFGGTGFVVARDLVMTNRHVAALFAAGIGARNLRFLEHMGAAIDFAREHDQSSGGTPFAVRDIVMIHPYWDLALLRVEGLEDREPLTFAAHEPDPANPRRIAVIGYPAFDPRNPAAVQDQVFHGIYNVKRLQPGLYNGRRKIDSYGKLVDAGTHDSSTLGGNSGSVIVEADGGKVVGLHFAGVYKDSNFAVPASDLARDPRMIDAGLKFDPGAEASAGPWDIFWAAASSVSSEGGTAQRGQAVMADEGKTISLTVPVEIELSIGVAGASVAGASAAIGGGTPTEKMVEPFHDPIERPRGGYDPAFLGIDVPMPEPRRPEECARLANGSNELKYHNFSVVMNAGRRLALFAASNVDARAAAKEPEPGYKYTRAGLSGLGEGDVEKWYADPRIRGIEQLPDRFFTKDRKAFDKGHIVRREDVAWGGSFLDVRRANGDTYFVTNCSPQTAGFNRSNRKDNWGALEDLVLKQAQAEKYCLFAGPVLKDSDPEFSGVDDLDGIKVRIPKSYWKVVVARAGNALKVFAFVLGQDLAQTPMEFAVPASWQGHMVRLSQLQTELGSLDFAPELLAADQFDAVRAADEAVAIDAAMKAIKALVPAEVQTEGPARNHGRFVGLPLQVQFNTDEDDRRSAKLLQALTYVQPDGNEWTAPMDSVLDGASIPRPFWSVIGGPFEGLYLEASVVHDYYCDHRVRPWRDVHRMFYDAMLCRGVSGFKARIMYYAVYRFGPRWEMVEGLKSVVMPAEALTDDKAPSILADAEILAHELPSEVIEAIAERSAAEARL